MDIKTFFSECNKVALGFSGGVDSSYLLYTGLKHGADIQAYFVKSAFQPEFELEDAYRLAKLLDAKLTVIQLDILSDSQVTINPVDRCYYCKKAILQVLKNKAAEDGYTTLIDGTNASDEAGDRAGMRALGEMSVRSPLRECGITKDEIRRLSKEAGLFTWNKPAYACLATRIPTERHITTELLQKVEAAENELMRMGFSDIRVRVLEDAARIQFPLEQMPVVLEKRESIVDAIKPYFSTVLLDLSGR